VLKLVKELPLVPRQYFKKLEGMNELWEVRAEFGGNAFRLLGFWEEDGLIILTNAMDLRRKHRRHQTGKSNSPPSGGAIT